MPDSSVPDGARPALLLLVHRIPYPPDKGDKIRSYHLLRYLAQRYRVFLGAFVDDTADRVHTGKVAQWCEDSCFVPVNPVLRKMASLRGIFTGVALTLPFYASSRLQGWVNQVIERHQVSRAIAFSSATAQFLLQRQHSSLRRVMDFIDIDSDKWAQYAARKRFPMSWLYRRESRRLLAFERRVASSFAASVFVSDHESALFRQLAPEAAASVHTIYNGVDLDLFDPVIEHADPFLPYPNAYHLVFVGAMDYWPNVDAVSWFAREVLPHVSSDKPVHLWIVGSRPTRQVQALARSAQVHVTGRVDDIRRYARHADICLAPLRVARGIQNKVLESLALARATLVTPNALEGIPAQHGEHLWVAADAPALAEATEQLLDAPELRDRLGRSGRKLVEQRFGWEDNLKQFSSLLESSTGS